MFRLYLNHVLPIYNHFSFSSKIKFWTYLFSLAITNVLDLFGILAMGLLAVQGLGNNEISHISFPGSNLLTETLHLNDQKNLLLAVVSLFILKSVLGLLASRHLFRFLSSKTTEISGLLFKSVMNREREARDEDSSQETAVLLTFGAQAAVFDALGYGAIAISEIVLIILVSTFLVVLMPLTGTLVIMYFLVIAICLNVFVSGLSRRLEVANKAANVEAIQVIQSSLSLKPEISIMDKKAYFQEKYERIFHRQSVSISSLQVLGIMPKYLLESFLVLGALLIGVFSAQLGDGADVVVQMVVVLTAASRIMPSFLRLQSSFTQISRSFALSPKVNEMLQSLKVQHTFNGISHYLEVDSVNAIEVKNLSFSYSNSSHLVFNNLSFSIPKNCVFTIVGHSGVGKTTLLRILLGQLQPSEGEVIYGQPLKMGKPTFGLVPQNPQFLNATIRENIALGVELDAIDEELVLICLKSANILEEVLLLPNGIDSNLGESFRKFSGGQRQRLNIARALYSKPQILVFDEPTSALDEEARHSFIDLIASISKSVTVIVVSHDDEIIKCSDEVFVLK